MGDQRDPLRDNALYRPKISKEYLIEEGTPKTRGDIEEIKYISEKLPNTSTRVRSSVDDSEHTFVILDYPWVHNDTFGNRISSHLVYTPRGARVLETRDEITEEVLRKAISECKTIPLESGIVPFGTQGDEEVLSLGRDLTFLLNTGESNIANFREVQVAEIGPLLSPSISEQRKIDNSKMINAEIDRILSIPE